MIESVFRLGYLIIYPPVSITVFNPVCVKKAGIPDPPHLSFSAKVPYGVSSNSKFPLRYSSSNNLFSPT